MPKLETPRSFVENNTGYGGKKFVQLMDAIEARDAQYLALLKTCGEALEKVQSVKAIVQSIERSEDWSGGEPERAGRALQTASQMSWRGVEAQGGRPMSALSDALRAEAKGEGK